MTDFLEQSKSFQRGVVTILTQRFKRGLICGIQTINLKGDDSVIDIKRQSLVSMEMVEIFKKAEEFENKVEDEETGGFTEIDDSSTITDKIFKEKCIEAMKICRRYAYWFFFLEKISITTEHISYILTVVVAYYQFELKEIIWAVIIIAIIIMLSSFGDWARLREKYSHLHNLFRFLLNSKSDSRVLEFRNYAYLFGSDELFIDSIVLTDTKDF